MPAAPLSRGPPGVVRPPGTDSSAAAPFDLLLQLLGNSLPPALPGGETLPAESADGSAVDESAQFVSAPAFRDFDGLAAATALPLPVPLQGMVAPLEPADGSARADLGAALRLALATDSRARGASSAQWPPTTGAPAAGSAATDSSVVRPPGPD